MRVWIASESSTERRVKERASPLVKLFHKVEAIQHGCATRRTPRAPATHGRQNIVCYLAVIGLVTASIIPLLC